MNSPPINRFIVRETFRAGGMTAALLGAALLLGGCATCTPQKDVELFSRAAPPMTRVDAGHLFSSADKLVAAREGDFVLVGAGESMAPYYTAGTVLVIHPTSFFMLRPGMVAVYRNRSGIQVAHVLIEKAESGWVAMGLNNDGPDEEMVTPENLVGIVSHAFAAGSATPRAGIEMAGLETGARSRIALLH